MRESDEVGRVGRGRIGRTRLGPTSRQGPAGRWTWWTAEDEARVDGSGDNG